MKETTIFKEIDDQSIDLLHDLADDAIKDGYDFVKRTIIEWKNGSITSKIFRTFKKA